MSRGRANQRADGILRHARCSSRIKAVTPVACGDAIQVPLIQTKPVACGDAIQVPLIQTKRPPPLSTALNAEWFALS